MRHYDFSPLYRSFVGLDRMAGLIDAAQTQSQSTTGYPPYNVARISEDAYRIELAVAGFSDADLDIQSEQNLLTVTGRIVDESANDTDDDTSVEYLHRGIAKRGFERRFQLADHVYVKDAELTNGLLVISLQRELPEALKPRRIAIGANTNAADGEKLIAAKSGSQPKAA